jgi:hypothetical protein
MRKAMIVPGAAVAALAAAGCATGAGPGLVMTLEPSTTRVEGWLASDGELTVFPRPLKAAYDPYAGDERARCVSVIDATGQGRAALAKLNGRRVIVTGRRHGAWRPAAGAEVLWRAGRAERLRAVVCVCCADGGGGEVGGRAPSARESHILLARAATL